MKSRRLQKQLAYMKRKGLKSASLTDAQREIIKDRYRLSRAFRRRNK